MGALRSVPTTFHLPLAKFDAIFVLLLNVFFIVIILPEGFPTYFQTEPVEKYIPFISPLFTPFFLRTEPVKKEPGPPRFCQIKIQRFQHLRYLLNLTVTVTK